MPEIEHRQCNQFNHEILHPELQPGSGMAGFTNYIDTAARFVEIVSGCPAPE